MNITQSLHKAVATVTALGAAFALSACFESEQVITVKKDGSGTVVTKMIMGAQAVAMMKAAQAQGGGAEGEKAKDPMLDPEQYKTKAAAMGDGVEFVDVKPLKLDDGREGAIATYKFADVRKLKAEPGDSPGGDEAAAGDAKKSQIAFGFTPGDNPKLTIVMPQPPKEEEKKKDDPAEPKVAEDDAQADAAMAMMAPMMQGMRVATKVKVEGEITKTNAAHKEGSTVTLMDIDMGKLLSNKEIMKKMKSPDDMKDFAKFAKIAKEAGATIEPSPEVTVEFK